MTRKVVIAGFPGVQALDVVGPHDVFTGASLLTGGGYDVVVGSVDGGPVATPTGLAFVAAPLPDPGDVARRSTRSSCRVAVVSRRRGRMPS